MEIPKMFMGRKREPGAIERILKTDPQVPENKPNPFQVTAPKNLDGSKYIRIPGTNFLIAKEETHKGKNWNDAQYALSDEGLFMPSPALFLPYFVNVRDANQGKVQLYDGNNIPLSKPETEDLWKYLSTAHRSGCWTWLDALFVPTTAGFDLQTNHRVKTTNGKKELVGQRFNLEAHAGEDCFVNLDFNSQGLPKSKSSNQNYSQGDNIYFYQPRANCVAGFGAITDWAGLGCSGGPSGSGAGLGVFATAEGRSQTKT